MEFPDHPIFPAAPSKAPLTPHGFRDASTDPEQISAWWQRWPDALVAVPTGRQSGILVVDIDPEALPWYERQEWQCGRIHRTRRGLHLLYRMPDTPIGCSSAGFPKGVDIRADGGYIIWWPSHGGEIIGDALLPPPEWVLRLLSPPKVTKSSSKPVKRRTKAVRRHVHYGGVGVMSCW